MEALVGQPWYKIQTSGAREGAFSKAGDEHIADRSKPKASTVYYAMMAKYETLMAGDKEQKLTRQMLAGNKGTLADRVSALMTLTEAAGLFSLPHIKRLLGMVQKKNVREQLLAMEALKKAYLEELLPSTRKLRFYEEDQVRNETDSIVRFFEDQLKLSFAAFTKILVDLFNKQSLPVVQSKALETAFELVRAKPEQERALLTLVVSGLGANVDEKAVCSKTNLLLRKMAGEHERMKEAIVAEVRNQHLSRLTDETLPHTYWAVNFLHGLPLNSKNDGDVARTIVETLIHVVVFCGERTVDEFKTKLTRLALEGLQKAFVVAKETAVLASPLSEATVKTLIKLSYETQVPNLAVAVLAFLGKAVDPTQPSRELVRALYFQCGRVEVLSCTAAKALVALVLEVAAKLDIFEQLAMLRRLLATLLAVAEPCDALLAQITDALRAIDQAALPASDATLKVDARDPAIASGGARLWEQALLNANFDESLVLAKKKRPTLSSLDLLREISQPERVTLFGFGKRHAEVAAMVPKRQKTEPKAADAEEDDHADAEIDEFMTNIGRANQEEAANDDENLDLDDEELEGLGEENEDAEDDEDDDDASFGESLGSDFDVDDDEDEEEDEAEEEEEEEEEVKRTKKTQALLKKFNGKTFVSAEELEGLDL